jgi:DnaJ-domain-containing protein 1
MGIDSFFDKLGDTIKSFVDELDGAKSESGSPNSRKRSFGDPDMDAAWDELNDFLNEDAPSSSRGSGQQAGPDTGASFGAAAGNFTRQGGIPDELKQDYANLGVPFGSSFEKVKASYKKMLMQYHPDRNSDNPEKLRIATEITQKINISYQRLEKWNETKTI